MKKKGEEQFDHAEPIGPVFQDTLFDAGALEKSNRSTLGRARIQTSGRGKVTKVRDAVLDVGSSIPTSHLQPRRPLLAAHGTEDRPETKMTFGPGQYQPERVHHNRSLDVEAMLAAGPEPPKIYKKSTRVEGDQIQIPSTGFDPYTTTVHEMGHRHHFSQFPSERSPGLASPLNQNADPLYEGVADAYVDRYRPSSSSSLRRSHKSPGAIGNDITRMEVTGYSTDYGSGARRTKRGTSGWVPEGRALYAATRAHFGATGDIPHYQPTSYQPQETRPSMLEEDDVSDPTTDATLHHLLTHSEHARSALEQTTTQAPGSSKKRVSLLPIAQAASRRHMDRELLRQGQYVQENLFGEEHMSRNQFGEVPRSVADVSETLGINPAMFNPAADVHPKRKLGRRGLT